MTIDRRIFLGSMAGGAVGAAASWPAFAQTYPNRPIKLIVPFGAGGPIDVVGRIVAQRLSASVGQVVIENRPGAGGTIAARLAAGSPPDGYTLFFGSSGPMAISPALYKDYDPAKLFEPIGLVSSNPYVLVVSPRVPVKSVAELVAYAKANPGKLNFGATLATPSHLAGEMLKLRSGADFAIIPYKQATNALTDMMGGAIDMTFEQPSVLLGHISERTFVPLAISDTARHPLLGEVPTMIESGFPGFTAYSWTGLAAPADTPADIVTRLNAALNEGFGQTDIKDAMEKIGANIRTGTPDDYRVFAASEAAKWGEVIRATGMKVE